MFLKSSTGRNGGYDARQIAVDMLLLFNSPSPTQVRVFTYLIGREMTFAENVKWIACNNKGKGKLTNDLKGEFY